LLRHHLWLRLSLGRWWPAHRHRPSLRGSLDPLLQHRQVLLRQVSYHLVHLLPLLEVGLRQCVQGSVSDPGVSVCDLLGHLLEHLAGLGATHPGAVAGDQRANLLETFCALLCILRRDASQHVVEQLAGRVKLANQLQNRLAACTDLVFRIANLDNQIWNKSNGFQIMKIIPVFILRKRSEDHVQILEPFNIYRRIRLEKP